jgi:hypothetical protein
MIRRLDAERLENILEALFKPIQPGGGVGGFFNRLFPRTSEPRREEV